MRSTKSDFLRRLSSVFALVLLSLFVTTASRADVVYFDPYGTAGANQSAVATFDFLPGNSLLRGIGSLLNNGTNIATQHSIQTRLGPLLDSNGDQINVPNMNGPTSNPNAFEITLWVNYSARADISGVHTDYGLDPNYTANTFELWYDTGYTSTSRADDLAGTGFRDGTLIMSGTLTDAIGSLTRFSPNTRFDQFPTSGSGSDDYSGLQTIPVVGGTTMTVGVDYSDPNFFITPLTTLAIQIYNQSNITPFNQVNPSHLFDGYTPQISGGSPFNGNGGKDDFQFQSDPNSSIIPNTVPEPSSLVLCALGGVALAFRRLRRRSAK